MSSSPNSVIKTFLTIITNFFLFSIILIVLIPLFTIFTFPLYIWRLIVILWVTATEEDITGIISPHDVIFTMDRIHENPTGGIPLLSILQGSINLQEVQSEFNNSVIKALHWRDHKTLVYGRLQQFPVRLGGFGFWKWDRSFQIKNHIHQSTNNSSVNEGNLLEFMTQMTRTPFPLNQSPWDMTFVPGYNGNPDLTLLIFRIHHSISDGYSTMKLFLMGLLGFRTPIPNQVISSGSSRVSDTKDWVSSKPKVSGFTGKILFYLETILGLPYIYLKEMSQLRDRYPLHDPRRLKPTGTWNASWTPKISLKDFKWASSKHNVPFTAILTSGIAGGIKMYLDKYYSVEEIPGKIHFFYPNPMPGHPNDRLTNHWSMGTTALTLDILEIDERLRRTKEEFLHLLKSPFGLVSYYVFKIIGTLPVPIFEKATHFQGGSFVLSNLPGPTERIHLFGHLVLDVMFWLPLMRELTGFNISALSYAGNLRIGIIADTGYIPDQGRLDELCSNIHQEVMTIIDHAPMSGVSNKTLSQII